MISQIAESSVVFFRANGHTHDGINSSLINTSPYSIFDFNLSTNSNFKDESINRTRVVNKLTFDSYIVNIINNIIGNSEIINNKTFVNPDINGGLDSRIYFDFVGTYSALAMNVETVEISTPAIHVQEILYFILQPPSGSNVRVWANLRTGAVSSNIGITASNEIIVSSSMRELKNNIAPIQDGVGLLKLLNPVNFEWKPEPDASEVAEFMNASDRRFGFIVEEIEAIDRGLVQYRYIGPEVENADDMFLSNSYFSLQHYDSAGLIAILTSALQNAIERIENLEQQVAGG